MSQHTETSDDDNTFGLDDVINTLTSDLKKASEKAAADGPFGLYLGSAEVELQFTVTRTTSGGGKAGVKFSVFGVGADFGGHANRESSNEAIQRLRLTLLPVPDQEAGPADTSNDDNEKPKYGGGGGGKMFK